MKLLTALLFLTLVPAFPALADTYDKVAAKVGTDMISSFEVDEAVNAVKAQMDPEELATEEGRTRLAQARRDILDKLIDQKVILQEAERFGQDEKDASGKTVPRANPFVPKEEEVEEMVAQNFDATKARFGSDAAFHAELTKEMLTEDSLKARLGERLRDQMIVNRMLKAKEKEMQGTFSVSAEEAREFFEKNKDQFGSGDQVKLRTIYLSPKSSKGLAAKLRSRLDRGEDFAQLARQYSDDDTNKQAGGEVGWIDKGTLEFPQVEKAAFKAKPGQAVGPISTPKGVYFVQVEQARQGAPKTFDDVKQQAMNAVYSSKLEDRIQNWIKDLKQKTFVEIVE